MRVVIQRVSHACVSVDNVVHGKTDRGYLVFLGIGENDTEIIADCLLKKIINLRIFADENDKINLSLKDVGGSMLVVSQFTLYADCRKGNRPNFTMAAKPDKAEKLYDYFIEQCRKEEIHVESGIFGADMKVDLLNDGPFTIYLEA